MDPNVDVGGEVLPHLLYEQMKHSAAFDSEVKHYLRTLADGTYRVLMSANDRYLELDRMGRHRKAQLQGQERDKSNKVALTAASPEKDTKRSGVTPRLRLFSDSGETAPRASFFRRGNAERTKTVGTNM